MDEVASFGVWLRRRRRALDLTQADLADRASCSPGAVRKLEADARRPSRELAGRLAEALGVPLGERAAVLRVARAELAADRLPPPADPAPLEPPTSTASATRPAPGLTPGLTSFVGRERELAEVRRRLGGARLLTLTGAGGVGKTRLALEVARAVQSDYADGVWLVELAALADEAVAPEAVARALGVPEQAGRSSAETLAAWLAAKRALLVLDNCEHLIDACAALADALLGACPRLTVLATSREPLRIGGELTWRVPSLSLPDGRTLPTPARVAGSEAARLFVARAALARPGFALTDRNAAAVAEVCRRLDGLPLALELAAARTRALAVEQIAARLDDGVRLLTGGSRTALPRQQTLRATLDWSHDLLEAAERVAFRRLAVFAGGWTLEAAEAVCSGDGIEDRAVLDLLARLIDKSLVQVEDQGGAARYRLLEPVRQYGLERLREAGEEAVTRGRHLAWCLALGETAAPHLEGEGVWLWGARLDAEHDNLRTALAWGLDHDTESSLRLAGSLRNFWQARSYFAEAHRWYDRLLPRAPTPTVARIRALLGASLVDRQLSHFAVSLARGEEALALSRVRGETRLTAEALYMVARVHTLQGDLGLARPLLEEGVALSRAGGDRRNLGANLFWLGRLALEQGEYAPARACLEEALALGPALGFFHQGGHIAMELGLVALCQGDDARAEALLDEALALGRRVNSPAVTASALARLSRVATWRGDRERAVRLAEESLTLTRSMLSNQRPTGDRLVNLGQALYHQGDLAGARARLEEGLAVNRATGQRLGISAALHGLGLVAWRQGDAARATAHLRESLALRWRLGDRLGIAECLEAIATVAAGTGQPGPAARLLGAATAWRETGGTPRPPVERADHEATVAAARTALGEGAFAAAMAKGRAMTLEAAVAEALAEDSAVG